MAVILTPEQIMLGPSIDSAHQFSQIELKRWMEQQEGVIAAGVAYRVDDLADLPDASTVTNGVFALVINDAVTAQRGTYQEQSDAWVKVSELPSGLTTTDPVVLVASGSGDAITATAQRAFQTAAFAETFTMQVAAANTGPVTVAIDGGAAISLRTSSGVELSANYLTVGSVVDFRFDGVFYRLTSTVSDAAIQAATVAAQVAAETAEANAAASESAAAASAANAAVDRASVAALAASTPTDYVVATFAALPGSPVSGEIALILADENAGGLTTFRTFTTVWGDPVYLSPVFRSVADLVAAPGTFVEGDTVSVNGAGGAFSYIVAPSAATDHHLTTAGGSKLYVQENFGLPFRAFGPVRDGTIQEAPSTDVIFTTYNVSGTDDGGALNDAISATLGGNVGLLRVESGQYYINTDIDLTAGLGAAGRGLTIQGTGASSSGHLQFGFGRQGTTLLLENGITVSATETTTTIKSLMIYGQTTGTLVDLDDALTDRGGLYDVVVINNTVDATYNSSEAVSVSAFFTSEISKCRIVGRRDFRAVYGDNTVSSSGIAVDSANMFFGDGLHCDTTGQGNIGTIDGLTVTGFRRGLVIEADAVSATKRIAHTRFSNFQANFCQTGIWLGQGVEDIMLESPTFEFCADEAIKMANGAGILNIIGGRTSGSRRQYDDGSGAVSQRMKNAGMTFGDPVDANNAWGGAVIKNHSFITLSNMNAGVLLHAGTGAGFVKLEDCIYGGGGPVVILDMTNAANGVPDVWIKNGFEDVTNGGFPPNNRWICTFTRNDDYTLHTVQDANWYGRIEGVTYNIDAGAASAGALDFTGRRFIPAIIRPNSGVDLDITLSNSVWVGQDMEIEDRFGGGALDIIVPTGTRLQYNNGTSWASVSGPATVDLNAIAITANWILKKVDADEWSLRGITS